MGESTTEKTNGQTTSLTSRYTGTIDDNNVIQLICILESQVVLDGELLYTKILEEAIRPVDWREISMKQSVGKCKQISF